MWVGVHELREIKWSSGVVEEEKAMITTRLEKGGDRGSGRRGMWYDGRVGEWFFLFFLSRVSFLMQPGH
jgi:hypothetical protein